MGVDVATETVIARPRAEVAAFAADPLNAPIWYVNIARAGWVGPPNLAPGGAVAFEARFLGRVLRYTYRIVDYRPGEVLVMRTADGPFPMETRYHWSDAAQGTRMRLRNLGQPQGFSTLMAPLMAPAMRRANRADLARLKAILEAAGPPA